MSRKSRIRSDYRKRNFSKLDKKYSVPKGNDQVNYCIELDALIKSLEVIASNEHKKQLRENNRPSKRSTIEKGEYLQILRDILKARELEFTNTKCVAKIENAKLLETKAIATAGFKDYEEDVLEASDKERTKLFVIGGVVLLAGLLIILKVTKK